MAVLADCCSRAREGWVRLVHSVSRGDDVLRGGGCLPLSPGAAVAARAKMAGVAEAVPGGGDGGGGAGLCQGSPPEPSPQLLQAEVGQPRRNTFASGGDGQPPPCTETLGFYESDRRRKKKQCRAPSGKIPSRTPKYVQSFIFVESLGRECRKGEKQRVQSAFLGASSWETCGGWGNAESLGRRKSGVSPICTPTCWVPNVP